MSHLLHQLRLLGCAVLLAVPLTGCSLLLEFDDNSGSGGIDDADTSGGGDDVTGTDIQVLSGGCLTLHGVTLDELETGDPILLGAIFPLTGELAPFGPDMSRAVEMAVDEINLSGLFGRDLAVLTCDSATDPVVSVEAADHLLALGVPAIVGPAGSTNTIEVFNKAAHDAGAVVISPSATSPQISTIFDDDLLWRTVPSDDGQGKAIAEYILAGDFDRAGVVYRKDAYGQGLEAAIRDRLCGEDFDCSTRLIGEQYEVDGVTSFQFGAQIQDLVEFDPDLIVVVGFLEEGSQFVESAAGSGLKSFLLTDGMKDAQLAKEIQDPEVLCTLVGTAPAAPSVDDFDRFAFDFEATYDHEPGLFSANAYDALYSVAFAAASVKSYGSLDAITGAQLADGLKRLTGGTQEIRVGVTDWGLGSQILGSSEEESVDLVGASGPLDFDPVTGQPSGQIELWRYNPDEETIESVHIIYSDLGGYDPPPAGTLDPIGTCAE